jgi:hypothetical protein
VRALRSDDLLRRLGSGVRPADGAAAARAGANHPDFRMLLGAARRGEFSSGRSVRGADRLGIELTEDEQAELDRAADAAEAAGAGAMLAVIAGAALRVDVASREAIDARPLRSDPSESPELTTGIDAAVVLSSAQRAAGEDDEDAEPVAPRLRGDAGTIGPPARISNASLRRRLAQHDSRGD